MNTVSRILGTAVLLAAAGCGDMKRGEKAPVFRFAPITRTDVVRTVEATGTITPRKAKNGIPVGAQVNGKIIKLFVDYNSTVTNGQVVALIDPQVYEANYKSAVAQLHVNQANVQVRKANVKSCEAELALAEKTYERKKTLVGKGTAPVADLDGAEEALLKSRASLESAKASLRSAEASVKQSEASVEQAKANLDYCTIISPVNGIVIDHITAGKGKEIYNLLHLSSLDCMVALITNASSVKMGRKDIIKIDEAIELDTDALGYVDPGVTVSIIANGETVEKKKLDLPLELEGVLLTMFDSRTNLSQQVVREVKKHFP